MTRTPRMAVRIVSLVALLSLTAWAAAQQSVVQPGQAGGVLPRRPVVRAAGQQRPVPIRAPFILTPQQQQFLDKMLAAWERRSDQIKKFQCKFKRWEYGAAFGPRGPKGRLNAHTISDGEIRYAQPDVGMMRVKNKTVWNQRANGGKGGFIPFKGDPGEHWVCDGKAVYSLDAEAKEVIEHILPPEMQGKAISDGPLPFLFGAKADRLRARYFMRENTDPKFASKEIWLEAYPRKRRDAANFTRVQLIMTREDFLPYALRVYLPGGKDFVVYEFTDIGINSPFMRKPKAPATPRGWKRVVTQPPQAAKPDARNAGASRKAPR